MNSPIAFYGGLTIVFGTHIYMLMETMPSDYHTPHAIINLVAGGLIVYGA